MAEGAPLLANYSSVPEIQKSTLQLVITQTFESITNLSKLLPTCTVILFQLLLPVFSTIPAGESSCNEISRFLTLGLLIFCEISCFIQSFTDSWRDENGTCFHGFATLNGLWIIDGTAQGSIPPEMAERFKLKPVDFLHAIMSCLVFGAIALFNQTVVKCIFPDPSPTTQQLLAILPVGIGALGSFLFTRFPTTRHGIGFSVSATTTITTTTTTPPTTGTA